MQRFCLRQSRGEILPEALRAFADYRMVLYSLLLIAVMIFKPSGLMGTYDFSLNRLLEKTLNIGNRDANGKAVER